MDWGADPLWPRRLIRARKSGALTPTEVALITWLYARQSQIEADWALVHPADTGPGGDVSPAGYTDMLVRLQIDDEERWMDPACAECAPFEVRTELLGADVLGDDLSRTPEPTPGRWTVVDGDDWVRWELTGAAALDLRRWLAEVDIEERWAALASRMAGPGAELVEAEGIETLGAAIRVAARGGQGVAADPLSLPVPRDDGSAWVRWPGLRERMRAMTEPIDEITVEAGALTYERVVDGDNLVERLVVHDRTLSARDVRTIGRHRRAGPSAPAEGSQPQQQSEDPSPDEAEPTAHDRDRQEALGQQTSGQGDGAGLDAHEAQVKGHEQQP